MDICLFFRSLITVAKLAKEEIAPLVKKMEKEGKIDDGVLQTLFQNGVRKYRIYRCVHDTSIVYRVDEI